MHLLLLFDCCPLPVIPKTVLDFPVWLLQADKDPVQPLWYFDGGTDLFPNATLQLVKDSGHFSELEQPEAVSQAIRGFLQE